MRCGALRYEFIQMLLRRCTDEDACSQIAAGPQSPFLPHRDAFSSQIEEELMINTGFRTAYDWLQV